MVKMMAVVKEVKRMRLFGVNIAKEVRKMRLFGKDIWSEVEILDQQQQLQSPPVLLSAAAAPSPPLLPPAAPVPVFPYNSMSCSHSTAPPGKDDVLARKLKIKFIAPRPPPAANNIAPQLPLKVLATIKNLGGTDLVFLANKKVEVSDVEKKLNRLFIPKDAVTALLKALTAEEKTMLKIRGDKIEKKKKKNGKNNNNNARVEGEIVVTMVDRKGKRHVMNFKQWPSLGKLVFANHWYKFARESELEGGVDSVQLWCFRDVHSRLCFSVVKNEN